MHSLADILLFMKPVHELYANATYLPFQDIKNYKMLCEFGDYLLASPIGKDNELRFVTWRYVYNHEGVGLGRYFNTDYEVVKQDFGVRYGLVDEKKLFEEWSLPLCMMPACIAVEL